MRIIDGDGHVFEDNEAMAKFLPSPYNEGRTPDQLFPPLDHLHAFIGQTPPGSFRRVGLDGWLEFLEDVGIQTAVLYTTGGLSYGKIFHLDWAIALTRAYNDWLHEAYLTKSPRFKGMALIPMQEPEAAVVELRRAVEELGFCGAMLPSTGLKDHLGAKDYWPVYREADRLGCAIGIHGGAHSGLGFDHMNVYTPVGAMGHPIGLLINFSGIVFNGILDRFPNAKFGFMEGGVAWLLMALERFDRAHETHIQYNPRGELSPKADEKVSDYIRKHVKEGRLFIGCEGDEPALAYATSQVGSGAFIYSSDFPHEVNNAMCKKEIEELLETDELTDADKENILHANAERFYGLTRQTMEKVERTAARAARP
ncbi:MAG: amidohydrolase family protein [Deltaproteobacteria bacterium]|nr:amidohydrolase family protein [Deltaproteobacteria bacterium]